MIEFAPVGPACRAGPAKIGSQGSVGNGLRAVPVAATKRPRDRNGTARRPFPTDLTDFGRQKTSGDCGKREGSMVAAKVACPKCKAVLKITQKVSPGRKVNCPKCGTPFEIVSA